MDPLKLSKPLGKCSPLRACPPFLKPHFSLLCTSSPAVFSSSPPLFFRLLWDPLLPAFQMLVLLSWALCSSVTMDPPFGQTYLPLCDDAAEICILPSILLISIINQACPDPISHYLQSQVCSPLRIPISVKVTTIHLDNQARNQASLCLITHPQVKIIKCYPFYLPNMSWIHSLMHDGQDSPLGFKPCPCHLQ